MSASVFAFLAQVQERGAQLPEPLAAALLLAAVRLSEKNAQAVRPDLLVVDENGGLTLRKGLPDREGPYSAPELAGEKVSSRDPRVLVYAAGALGYELCTLETPHPGATTAGLLGPVIQKALAADRKDRFRNLEEMAHAIQEFQKRPTNEEERLILAAVVQSSAAPKSIAKVSTRKIHAFYALDPKDAPGGDDDEQPAPSTQKAPAPGWDPQDRTPRVVFPKNPPNGAPPGNAEAPAPANAEPPAPAKTEASGAARAETHAPRKAETPGPARERTPIEGKAESPALAPVQPREQRKDVAFEEVRALAEEFKADRKARSDEFMLLDSRLDSLSLLAQKVDALPRIAEKVEALSHLAERVDALSRLAARVEALEKRPAAENRPANAAPAKTTWRAPAWPAALLGAAAGAGAAAVMLLLVKPTSPAMPHPLPAVAKLSPSTAAVPAPAANPPAPAIAAATPVDIALPLPPPPEMPKPEAAASRPERAPRPRKVAAAPPPGRAEALAEAGKGEKALRAFDVAGAASAFQSALRLDANLPSAHRGMGMVQVLQGRDAQAKSEYRKYLELAPDAPDREQIQRLLDR